MSGTVPLVSILLITYNHEQFIERAIASIDQQVAPFEIEIVVADDSSTDGTPSILRRWVETSGRTVRILPAQPRLGITLNYARGFAACRGAYIAVLEGDDEWLSVDKVRLAAEYLDEHPEHSMVANRILLRHDLDGRASVIPAIAFSQLTGEVNARRLAEVNWFATFSACTYRSEAIERIDPGVFESTSYDWMVNLSVLNFGPAGFLPQVMTLYRQHSGGEWSRASQLERDLRIRDLLPAYIAMATDDVRPELTRLMHDLDERLRTSQTTGADSIGEPSRAREWALPIPRVTIAHPPLVSVVMASYNHQRWVEESIDSVLDQTFGDLELIIVDDASTDDTLERVARFDDPRIRVFHFDSNQGAAAALNFAIQQSRSPYIAIINSDDAWEPEKLERQLAEFEAHPEVGAVFTGVRFVDEAGENLSPSAIPQWHNVFRQANRSQAQWLRFFFEQGNALCHPSAVVRREVYQRVGLYDNRMRQIPDLDQWIRLIKQWPIRVMSDQDLVRFRLLTSQQNASHASRANVIRNLHEHLAIDERFFDDCSDELLVEAFGDVMVDSTLRWPDQRACEIAFLWWNVPCAMRGVNRVHGLSVVRRLMADENAALLLRGRYNFSDLDLHRLSGEEDADLPLVTREMLESILTDRDVLAPVETIPSSRMLRIILGRMKAVPRRRWPIQMAKTLRSLAR